MSLYVGRELAERKKKKRRRKKKKKKRDKLNEAEMQKFGTQSS